MARCPDCNKFVSYDEPVVEQESIDIDGTAIEGEVRVALPCGECGTELKECTISFSEEIEHECIESAVKDRIEELIESGELEDDKDTIQEFIDSDPEYEFEDDCPDWNPIDRHETKDRNGKPIKNSRYMKHYFGAETEVTVICSKCGSTIQVPISCEEQASYFDEI